jgi:MYXO-CTERM domain-containing protein
MQARTLSHLLVPSALVSSLLAVAEPASAHFRLEAPAAKYAQNGMGDPQKDGPCGGGSTNTGAVTAVQSGQTLTITIDETVFHPGHYRISIAQDEAGLPAEPPVMGANCGSAAIDPAPALPVLADGVFVHTDNFSGPQTFELPIPDDFTCDNCVLQVLEFMSEHVEPCFYYHCATVTVQSEPVMSTASSSSAGPSSGAGPGSSGSGAGSASTGSGSGGGDGIDDGGDDGCGCRTVGEPEDSSPTGGLFALAALGAALALGRRASRR